MDLMRRTKGTDSMPTRLFWIPTRRELAATCTGTMPFTDTRVAPKMPLVSTRKTALLLRRWPVSSRQPSPGVTTIHSEYRVKGFTERHPDVPEELRGTYAGLASPAAIQYLRDLGVTAVELLPIHYHIDEHFLIEKGLVNYWGYNTLGYFAPDPRYAAGGAQRSAQEFKSMVRTLHAEGFEVILDVVYNHTAEGNSEGPLSASEGSPMKSITSSITTAPGTQITVAPEIL